MVTTPTLTTPIELLAAQVDCEVLTLPTVDGELVQKLADPRWWDLAGEAEVSAILRAVVRRIVVTRQAPSAIDLTL